MWKKVLPPTLLLFLLFASIEGSAASEAFLNISNTGVIDYTSSSNPSWVPSDATVWFRTDFSTTQKVVTSTSFDLSDFPTPMYSHLSTEFAFSFEELLGKRALKVTWGDELIVDGANPRPMVLLYNTPNEYWIEEEIYLPPDFNLKNWLSIGQPFLGHYFGSSNNYPSERYTSSIFLQGSGGDGSGEIRIRNEINYHTATSSSSQTKTNIWNSGNQALIQRGVPFVIRAHVKLDSVNGILELWIDETKLTDYNGQTLTQEANEIEPINHYKQVDEAVALIYYRNIQVWMR